jgi:small subunit ribosomal protein S2
MGAVSMRQLLEAGIHFGHQTRRWNPKMDRFIYGERNGIYIIDLQKTLHQANKAYAFVRDKVASGGLVLFVGTKKQAQEPIAREAQRCGMYFVNNRWLGGTLTNWATVRQSIRTLIRLEEMESTGELDKLGKKEAARLRRDIAKLQKNLKGIKLMDRTPDVLFVIDVKKEAIAVQEARRLGITCIGVVDTNGDPDTVPIPVPGNDDAIRAVNLFCKIMADAVVEGNSVGEKVRAEEVKRRIQASAQSSKPEQAAAAVEEVVEDDTADVAVAAEFEE